MGLFNAVMALSGMIDTDVIEDERLARHTSYRIGGKADLFVTCHSYHALRRAVAVLDREQVPWVIIGKGSNLLVADGGYRGAVISLGREFQRTVVADDGCTLTVGAGVMFARLVNDALSRSLSGLEFAVGIPGSVGGAISMNAGTRTEWIGSLVEDVVTFDPASGIKHYAGSEITWGYRECSFPAMRSSSSACSSLNRRQGRHSRAHGAVPDEAQAYAAHGSRILRVGLSQSARCECGQAYRGLWIKGFFNWRRGSFARSR